MKYSHGSLKSRNPDVIAGVEFRNRLQTEFDGVNLPNSMVFDYPTITEARHFVCKSRTRLTGRACATAACAS